MNHEKQKNENGSISESKRAEVAAGNFFNIAEKNLNSNEKNLKNYEIFSSVGREVAQGNYDMAQRTLESNVKWNDSLRESASEINQIDRERKGADSMTIEEVQNTISEYARKLEQTSKEKGGKLSDLEDSMELDNISADISEAGIKGVDNAINYLEGVLKSKANIIDSVRPEDKSIFLKDWEEKRAMRDALFEEKQKQLEQQKKGEEILKEVDKERISASRNLENLYDQAGVPEDTPSRQEFLKKVSRMSSDELYFLENDLKKTANEFGRTRDSKTLDAHLMDFALKSFKTEDVARKHKEEDQKKIEEIRKNLGLSEHESQEQKKEQLPQDSQTLNRYFVDTFRRFEDTTLDNFKQEFTPEIEKKFQEWAKQKIDTLIKEKPLGARYPETVANIMGNSPDILQRIISLKEGRIVDYDELLKMPFSEVAKKYLDIDLPEEYFQHFSER